MGERTYQKIQKTSRLSPVSHEADGLGSVTSISNAASALAQTYTFNAFGKLTASSGSLTNPFQYTGRDFDSETGLYYNRARHYDSAAGRFVSEDPLRFAAGANFYSYVRNNPSNFTDPLGLQEATVGGCALGGPVGCAGGAAVDGFVWLGGLALAASAARGPNPNPGKDKCDKKGCKPCIPPVGTIAYRLDIVPPSTPHWPFKGTHWHLYEMNQNPNNCQCFWKDVGEGEGPVPPGSVPITPALGGGFQ